MPDSTVSAADGHDPHAAHQRLELTIVVPTFNERANVAKLVSKLETVLAGVAWQVIFVDDNSPDGTAAEVKAIARHVTHAAAGLGAAREFCDLLLVASGRYAQLLEGYA